MCVVDDFFYIETQYCELGNYLLFLFFFIVVVVVV